jgi:hypothetical protein
MVMRNRHDGTNTPGWWDDLPPATRKRFSTVPRGDRRQDGEAPNSGARQSSPGRLGMVRDLTRLGVLFVIVALANLLFLLIALTFLSGHAPLAR